MFREKLKKDLDGISPDDKLLSRVSQMMAEEAARPKQPIYMNAAKWGGMAAAICLIAVGAIAFLGNDNSLEAASDSAGVAADRAAYENSAEATKSQAADITGYALDDAAADYDSSEAADTEAYSLSEGYALEECTEEASDSAYTDSASLPQGESIAEAAGDSITAEAYSFSISIYRNGSEIQLTDTENAEILELAESYIAENSYTMLDLMLSDEETERYKENGLYIRMDIGGDCTIMVLADDNSSYIFYKWDFYSLSSEAADEFLKYLQ